MWSDETWRTPTPLTCHFHLRYTSSPITMPSSAREALAKLWRMPETARLPREREWVYFLEAACVPPLVKIGSSRTLKWRVITLGYSSPVALRLIGAVSAPAGTEFVLHAKFKTLRQHGEWFLLADPLPAFIASLPKGETLPSGTAERWASETGVPLKPSHETRKLLDPGSSAYRDSLYWSREHSRE